MDSLLPPSRASAARAARKRQKSGAPTVPPTDCLPPGAYALLVASLATERDVTAACERVFQSLDDHDDPVAILRTLRVLGMVLEASSLGRRLFCARAADIMQQCVRPKEARAAVVIAPAASPAARKLELFALGLISRAAARRGEPCPEDNVLIGVVAFWQSRHGIVFPPPLSDAEVTSGGRAIDSGGASPAPSAVGHSVDGARAAANDAAAALTLDVRAAYAGDTGPTFAVGDGAQLGRSSFFRLFAECQSTITMMASLTAIAAPGGSYAAPATFAVCGAAAATATVDIDGVDSDAASSQPLELEDEGSAFSPLEQDDGGAADVPAEGDDSGTSALAESSPATAAAAAAAAAGPPMLSSSLGEPGNGDDGDWEDVGVRSAPPAAAATTAAAGVTQRGATAAAEEAFRPILVPPDGMDPITVEVSAASVAAAASEPTAGTVVAEQMQDCVNSAARSLQPRLAALALRLAGGRGSDSALTAAAAARIAGLSEGLERQVFRASFLGVVPAPAAH